MSLFYVAIALGLALAIADKIDNKKERSKDDEQ